MFELLDKWIKQVGEGNVSQVLTNDHSNSMMTSNKYYLNFYLILNFEFLFNFKIWIFILRTYINYYVQCYIGLLKLKRSHLYWTPCVKHCLDLMLKKVVSLNDYIYNHLGLLNMRWFTKQREFFKLTKTRFATVFIALSRLHEQKNNLIKMFTSLYWSNSKWAIE